MKIDHLIDLYENRPEIPKEIEYAVLDMLGLTDLDSINQNFIQKILQLFSGENKTEYSGRHKEYTLYYLPMNFYKVWQPLMDLLKYRLLPQSINILEMGSGPGSCSFGIMEFYRMMAIENCDYNFEINFTLLERELEFINIFTKIFMRYKTIFPKNFQVNIKYCNVDLNNRYNFDENNKFDIIVESNMLNSNEKISSNTIKNLVQWSENHLKPHSSIILIEPADEKITKQIKEIKNHLFTCGFSSFSPCCCGSKNCKQFASAKNYVGKSQIGKALKSKSFNKIKEYHYFEYIVLRNDNLVKYRFEKNKLQLVDISKHINEEIAIKAFILSTSNQEEKISLKICDGSLCERRDIWLEIPKSILLAHDIDMVDVNRGEFVEIKNAKIISNNKIICEMHSKIKILR